MLRGMTREQEFQFPEEPMQIQLQQLDKTLRSLTAHLPDVVARIDAQGCIRYLNRDWSSWEHVVPEDYLGGSLEDCGLPIPVVQQLKDQLQQVKHTTQPVEFEIGAGHGIEDRHLEFRLFPECTTEGQVETILVICRDQSTSRKIERALGESELRRLQLESLGVLAGGVAHNFNNVLTAILGQISLAKEEVADPELVYPRLVMAERASRRAQEIAGQLLSFSSGGALKKTAVELDALLKETTRLVLIGTNVKPVFDLEGCGWIEADHGQLGQVVHNLVLNARQAMKEGGECLIRSRKVVSTDLPLSVQKGVSALCKDWIRVDCQDNGHGIAPEYVAKIFDPYFTMKSKGSGVGLTSSYFIMQAHGGSMTVESELGEGSTFSFFLPAFPMDQPSEKTSSQEVTKGSGTILIMDDDDDVRQVLGDMVRRCGYACEMVENGREAVRSYQEAQDRDQPFVLVLLDLTIPGEAGGREVVKELLWLNPEVKAMAVSGYSEDPILANFKDYGFVGSVKKPFEVSEMSAAIESVLREK